MASKFFEHFIAIADAMNHLGGDGLWDEEDGFHYNQLHIVLFHEYFHADEGRGLGASHQTGWTALAARLLEYRVRARG